MIEQYVIVLFYLIVLFYYNFKSDKVNYFYIGAVGTLVTSVILFFLVSSSRNVKKIFFDIVNCFYIFVILFIVFGQFPQIFLSVEMFVVLTSKFVGKLSFFDKFCQFTNFVRDLYFFPKSQVTSFFGHPSYQLVLLDRVSILGILFLVVAVVGFFINRRNRFVRICFFWIIFFFIILCLFGWGTAENGLVLYSLYFGFAYFSLFFMFFKELFNGKKWFNILILIFSIFMFIVNCVGFYDLFCFAVTYY